MFIFVRYFNDLLQKRSFIMFVIFFVLFTSCVKAASPVVYNPISDQVTSVCEQFEMVINTYDVFSDSDGDSLVITNVEQTDYSDLPVGLSLQGAPVFPSLVGSLSTNDARKVAIDGNYAYVADKEAGLKIIDVSNPASPSLTGSIGTDGYAYSVAVVDNYAYVGEWAGKIEIIDISNPASPSLTGSTSEYYYGMDVTVSGNYVYVAGYSDGLLIIDVSNPASPSLAGSIYTSSNTARGVAVSGNYAYVADYSSGLQIIDVSNPASPTLTASIDTDGYAYGVAVAGNYAYVADERGGLRIIDVSNPASPTLTGSVDTDGFAFDVKVIGYYAYVASASSGGDNAGLRIIDVSNHFAPSLVGSIDTYGDGANGVAVVGNYAYVAGGTDGLKVIEDVGGGVILKGTPGADDAEVLDIRVTASDGSNSVSTTFSLDIQNDAPVVLNDISQQTAYNGQLFNMMVNTYHTFRDPNNSQLDIVIKQADDSDLPAWLTAETGISPSLLSSSFGGARVDGVAIQGNYAYVTSSSGLEIFDVSDPDNLTLIGLVDTGNAQTVAVAGNYAYVANWSDFSIVDISNPFSPTIEGTGDFNTNIRVSIINNYAYLVSDYYGKLTIVDIRDSTNPSFVGNFESDGVVDIAINPLTEHAFLASGSALQVVDISNPATPSLVDTLSMSDAQGVEIINDYLYVADGTGGVKVIDISNPASVSIAGTLATSDAQKIVVSQNCAFTDDKYAYVADGSSALKIIDVSLPTNPSLVTTVDVTSNDVFVINDYAYVIDYYLEIVENAGGGISLQGTPSESDIGLLNLKVTASDGTNEITTTFSIDVQEEPLEDLGNTKKINPFISLL